MDCSSQACHSITCTAAALLHCVERHTADMDHFKAALAEAYTADSLFHELQQAHHK